VTSSRDTTFGRDILWPAPTCERRPVRPLKRREGQE
jgi:hypothetical protein